MQRARIFKRILILKRHLKQISNNIHLSNARKCFNNFRVTTATSFIDLRKAIFTRMQRRGAHPAAGYHLFRIHSLGFCAVRNLYYLRNLDTHCSRWNDTLSDWKLYVVARRWARRVRGLPHQCYFRARSIKSNDMSGRWKSSRHSAIRLWFSAAAIARFCRLGAVGWWFAKGCWFRYHLWTHPPTGLCLVADDSRRLVLGIH